MVDTNLNYINIKSEMTLSPSQIVEAGTKVGLPQDLVEQAEQSWLADVVKKHSSGDYTN
jgi:hypothetical protein